MSDEVELVHRAVINDSVIRFYVDSDERQLPWTGFADLIAFLRFPNRERLISALPRASPHSFRRGSDGALAIAAPAAIEIVEELADPGLADGWREAARVVLSEICRAPTDEEALANIARAQLNSWAIVEAGLKRLLATQH